MELEWIKVDLHHHTNEDKNRNNKAFDYEKILNFYNENKIKVISITNHNTISIDSINTYNKIIANNNLDIQILPGIEIEFTMEGQKNNKPNKKGHLNLIFNNKYNTNELSLFFSDTSNYDKNSTSNFKEYFPHVMNKLREKGFAEFIVMTDFAKSNPIDFETLNDKLLPWLYSMDILEGRICNENALNAINNSLKKAKLKEKKALYGGTDADNTNNCIEEAKKIKYVLIEPNFNGLIKMVQFPATRVSRNHDQPPVLLKDYIKSFTIDDTKIELHQGLNTIIGRRGSGKSYLFNSLIQKIKPSKEIKKYISGEKVKLEIEGDIDQSRVIKFTQNVISENLTSFINEISKNMLKDFDLIKSVFGNAYDRTNFLNAWESLFLNGNKLKKVMHSLLKIIQQINSEKIIENKEVYKSKIMDYFKKIIFESKNDKYIEQLDNDFKIVKKAYTEEKPSNWLQNELKGIEKKLSNIRQNKKYQTSEKINWISKTFSIDQESLKLNTNVEAIYAKKNDYIHQIQNLRNEFVENMSSSLLIIDKIENFYKKVKNNKQFIVQNKDAIATSDRIDKMPFLKFDIQIRNFVDIDGIDEVIDMFKNFVFKKDTMEKKTSITTLETMRMHVDIVARPKIHNIYIDEKSPGEQHEIFIDNILKIKNSDIIFLDQPDDDLDALTIQKNLIKRFTEHFNDKQWIVVTHDPKIVINSDSKTVIRTTYKKGKENNWFHEVKDEEMRKDAFQILDSKKEFPKIRWKKYMEDEWK